MQEIFRFVFLRSARPPRVGGLVAVPGNLTSFGHQLAALRQGEDARTRMRNAAAAFARTPDFSRDPSTLPLAAELMQLRTAIARQPAWSLADLARAVQRIVDSPAPAVVTTNEYRSLQRALVDGILVLKLRPDVAPTAVGEYARLLVMWTLIARIATRDGTLDGASSTQLLDAVLTYPGDLLPLPRVPDSTPGQPHQDDVPNRHTLSLELARVTEAAEEIRGVKGHELVERVPSPGSQPDRRRSGLVLAEGALRRLTATTRTTVERLGLVLADASRYEILTRLAAEGTRLRAGLRRAGEAAARPSTRIRIGGTTMPSPAAPAAADDIAQPTVSPVPTTVGLLRPSGVGDLQVVRHQIKRYDPTELSFIQNVLQTEKITRETRRLERTEQTVETDRESTREDERTLQSTDRFDLERETKNTLKEEDSFKFGTKVSGGFGKFVQAEVSVGVESSESEETANRTSAKFASEVVSKTAAKLTEKIREHQTLLTLREFEEKNSHGFDNTAGTGHVVGMYQWVERVYEAQVYNYGIRLFFDVMVPEPAAFYMQVLSHQTSAGLDEPERFTASPEDITETNYGDHVARYQVTAVEPPPPETIVVSKTLKLIIQEPSIVNMTILEDGAIGIPAGYEATHVRYRLTWSDMHIENVTPAPEGEMVLLIGQHMLTLDATIQDIDNVNIEGYFGDLPVDGETGELPYSLHFSAMNRIGMVIEVECTRSAQGYAAWKQRTWEAILQAYLRQEETYRNRLAELEAKQGVPIVGPDPLTNRIIERNEIKRSAISMLTGQYFVKFNAILSSGTQEARVDFDEALAEGNYARFFEQAFEWEFMEAEYLPYYWGRRSTWVDKLRIQGVDSTHVAFLQAGYARLRLSVRPDFERAVFHFLDTGEIWDGGELPPVTNRDYAGYLLEISERRRRRPDEETPVGDPFDVRLPTTLVRVRPTPTLPVWAKNDEGDWLPVEE